ncbi:MAG: hypothetical protein N3B11_03010 [Coriobacteriia bacterium]|nr:hypothetical protein [Coriobacteriia bacterium]
MDLRGSKAVAIIAAVAVAAAVLGGAAVWLAMKGRAPQAQQTSQGEATSSIEPTAAPSLPQTSTAAEEPTAAPSGTATTTPGSAAGDVVDQPTLVVDWNRTGDRIRLTLDYVQVLWGDDANEEAARRGLETPVPNDYLIVNDNRRLRVFPVRSGIMVHVLYNDDGTMSFEGRDITLDEWYARLEGPLADQYSSSYFLVTVRGGEIVRIAQQYTP